MITNKSIRVENEKFSVLEIITTFALVVGLLLCLGFESGHIAIGTTGIIIMAVSALLMNRFNNSKN